MAHSLSAQKRVRQTVKRNGRNRARKELLKNDTKAFTAALAGGDQVKVAEAFNAVSSRLDKTAAKHTIHKNTAARRRSRMAKKVNALKATAGTKA